MMYADHGYPQRHPDRVRRTRAYQKSTGQPGTFGDGHCGNIFFRDSGITHYLINQSNRATDMVAACQFRHYAAVGPMHVDLGVNRLREKPFFAVDHRRPGFITRTFNAENYHEKSP